MKSFELNDLDAAVVRSILLTHAEMQDQRTIQNEELRGRLSLEEADAPDLEETLGDLDDINTTLTSDIANLKRIADIFN